jgi:hypothetical protein
MRATLRRENLKKKLREKGREAGGWTLGEHASSRD